MELTGKTFLKPERKTLILNIAVPLIVGGASALLTGGKMKEFKQLNQPPLSPPAWLFPTVWTILFTLMGIASWRVLESDPETGSGALAEGGAENDTGSRAENSTENRAGRSGGTRSQQINSALRIYSIQLAVNFFWPIFFFQLGRYLFAFFWLLLLWVLIVIMTVKFYKIDKTAGKLLIPYLLWVTFAGYLNLGVALLN